MSDALPSTVTAKRFAFRGKALSEGERVVAGEVPVAVSYGGTTHAVMMATPDDLADFGVGFSLTEGVIASLADIAGVEIVEADDGFDVQVSLNDDQADALKSRRRAMAGPVGCGMCGIESIEQAVRVVPRVEPVAWTLSAEQIAAAVDRLSAAQPLNAQTRAVHAAGFYVPGQGLVAVREDVGRHNALDKLIGALLRSGISGRDGVVVLTSRVSVEMVQKTALLGAPALVAVSAPTALAIATAEKAGIMLVAVVRGEEFEVFTHMDRLDQGVNSNVA